VTQYRKVLGDLYKEFGEEEKGEDDKPTGRLVIRPENMAAFTEKQIGLLDHEVNFEMESLNLADFGDKVEGTSPDDFIACMAFIMRRKP